MYINGPLYILYNRFEYYVNKLKAYDGKRVLVVSKLIMSLYD